MTLIIYAHPDTGGHCAHILKCVKEKLNKQGKDFEVLDLYNEKYSPLLDASEHYTRGKSKVSKRNKEIQEKISKTNNLIFIFPVWWFGIPAVLKGFLDRVMTPGFAFNFWQGIPFGLLKGKKAIIFFTTGAPTIYYKMTCDLPKKNIVNTLRYCGISSNVYRFGKCLRFTEKDKLKIERKIRKIKVQ